MSQHITQLSYDLAKLRGIDPSQAFDALERGMEGQTRGLQELGIRITSTDLKNRALSEGLIKNGQVMTDQQIALMAYQEIMQKAGAVQGYYLTTTNDLSTQTTKLNAGWQEMKEKLAESLTPAFTEFMKVLNWVAGGFEVLVEDIATAIQYISLFVEDAISAIQDTFSLNFSNINEQWQNNYDSIFNSGEAAKQYGNALNDAISAANNNADATEMLFKCWTAAGMRSTSTMTQDLTTHIRTADIGMTPKVGCISFKPGTMPQELVGF